MNLAKLYLLALLTGLTSFNLGSCSAPPPATSERPTAAATSPPVAATKPASVPSLPSPLPTATATKLSPSEKTVPITLYKIDSQCQKLVSEKVAVAANQPMQAAIAKVLEDQDNADFSVAGYRVNVVDGIATVDLRVATGSKRKFQSLSSCEQLALFGGIRKTLIDNSAWKIQAVRFTEKGEEIVL